MKAEKIRGLDVNEIQRQNQDAQEQLPPKLLTEGARVDPEWLLHFLTNPALTIYNQNFAVVRDTIPLDLKSGVNDVRLAGTTAQLEPDSDGSWRFCFCYWGRQSSSILIFLNGIKDLRLAIGNESSGRDSPSVSIMNSTVKAL